MDHFTIKRICSILDGYISLKIPADLRGEVRITYHIGDRTVTMSEERPDWTERMWDSTDFVQFRLEDHAWAVYTKSDGNEWRSLSTITPSRHFEEVLEQVEMDTSEVIWVT
ncbi:DUF3024 domain-containing protein [Paenibacillus provencensis]|uniref:DUF3024 domain-containing protein n=1 Tax=Paenibacillus provencensis TaxID=441151 RepID=A0ABW3PQU7_9BACL|nr:DUF3024 domain-containing protein [Paenibacillus sp. MER 78]MCM3127142.1 DUF3024 domain-containing protein [Paenibacillus sp. MER 78]